MLLLLISFIAGILTVLAPCILPLLPVIIGGSLTGSGQGVQKRKVLTIVVSLGVSVILFTLLLKASTLFISIPENVWKYISGGIIITLGFITIFPSLWEGEWLANLSAKSNILLGKGDQKKSFWGDVIVGSALGPVFSTCSPTYFIVLATVLPVKPIIGMLYLLSYTLGLCLALFGIALVGQKVLDKLNIAADPKSLLKKTLGVLFLLVGIAVISGFDKKLQTSILDGGFFDITKVEQKLLELNDEKASSTENVVNSSMENKEPTKLSTLSEKKDLYNLAPEISSPDGFVNTDGKPITLAELKGKVVLLDIWTYSCINCQRTLPYLNEWYKKYKDDGLVIVGLHTPEFAFEKVLKNVESATEKFGIQYPVVLDNDYSTWNAYGNRYWPRKYLIDIDGFIVYDHIGEGDYDVTEKAIQKALQERSERMGLDKKISKDISEPSSAVKVESGNVRSPEVYFGSTRNDYLANGVRGLLGIQDFTLPKSIQLNSLYLSGSWNITPEFAENKNAGSIVFRFVSKNVYFVAGSDQSVTIAVYQDDVFVKEVTIDEEKLYSLIENNEYGEHTIRIEIKNPGVRVFTFTFG